MTDTTAPLVHHRDCNVLSKGTAAECNCNAAKFQTPDTDCPKGIPTSAEMIAAGRTPEAMAAVNTNPGWTKPETHVRTPVVTAPDTNALIERLKKHDEPFEKPSVDLDAIRYASECEGRRAVAIGKLCGEAAEALRTLTAENERLSHVFGKPAADWDRLETNLRHWKEECGKLHSQIAPLTEQLEQAQFWSDHTAAERDAAFGNCEQLQSQLEQHQWHKPENELPPSNKRVRIHWVNSLGNHRTSEGSYATEYSAEEPDWEGHEAMDIDGFDEQNDVFYRKPGWYEEPHESEFYYRITDTVLNWTEISHPGYSTPPENES